MKGHKMKRFSDYPGDGRTLIDSVSGSNCRHGYGRDFMAFFAIVAISAVFGTGTWATTRANVFCLSRKWTLCRMS